MSNTANLLFEIGCEELPPSLLSNLANQVKQNVTSKLKELDIPFNENEIESYYTPRRLTLIISNLPQVQEEKEIEIKGPPKNRAFDESGKPTQVAIGFSKKYNITPEELITKDVNGAEYIFVKTKTGGKDLKEVFSEILPESIRKTTGDKLMKWGDYNDKFIRPIRWIVSLFGDEVIKFKYANVESGNKTLGHRFLSSGELEIKEIKSYKEILERDGKVLINNTVRKEKTVSLVKECNKKEVGLDELSNPTLAETVTNITEFPSSVICEFDNEFLELPDIVTETVLDKHQKYFVIKKDGKLTNKFTVITNGTDLQSSSAKDNIKSGNEKVARARLNDALFFYKDDQKRPFTYEERGSDLENISFQKGFGSMKSKVERLAKLSTFIYEHLSQMTKLSCTKEDVLTAAKLCKLDLATQMVFEMPELQGEIGGIYAKNYGHSDAIGKGISKHYNQISFDNEVGNIIGLADKLDNIICLFAINKIPSSSSDPFGLIIQAELCIETVEVLFTNSASKIKLNLLEIIDNYSKTVNCKIVNEKLEPETIKKVKSFLVDRLKLVYKRKKISTPDIIDSALSTGNPLNKIYQTTDNIKLLNKCFQSPSEEDKNFLIAAKRLVRIVDKSANGNLDKSLLSSDCEKVLLSKLEEIGSKEYSSTEEYYKDLKNLTTPINNFFDNVLVNDKDPKIKQARHSLLNKGKMLFEKICDFNKIVERE